MKGLKEKVLFILTVEVISILIFALVGLLKLTKRYKERGLENFPKSPKGTIFLTNHPDGNEWVFVYNRFFRAYYFLAPWLYLSKLPSVIADKMNFDRPIIRNLKLKIITIDRNQEENNENDATRSRAAAFQKAVKVLKGGGNLIGFFEGSRTSNAKERIFSPEKNIPLGRLNESLGRLVRITNAEVEVGGIVFNQGFPSLREDGRFSGTRFRQWLKETLLGRNGTISCAWGRKRSFKEKSEIENYMLEQMDRAVSD